MKEPRPKLQKALRVFAVLLLIFSIVAFFLVVFTFSVSFIIGGQILSDGTGIMRLLLRPVHHGRLAIDSDLFAFAWLPGVGCVTAFLGYCSVLVHALRRHKQLGPAYPGARRYRIALCVLAALTLVLPLALWPISAPIVAQSGTFTQPMPTPVPGAILLGCTLLGILLANKQTPCAPETEDGGGTA